MFLIVMASMGMAKPSPKEEEFLVGQRNHNNPAGVASLLNRNRRPCPGVHRPTSPVRRARNQSAVVVLVEVRDR